MPRRFFRKFAIKRHELSRRWFMSPFRHLLHDHRLWNVRRKTVVPAFALGIFVAFIPFPGHPIWATFSALTLRINIPVAAITTFVSNPLTIGPMYLFTYRFGAWLLDIPFDPPAFEMSLDWVTHTFVNIWQPLVLGSLIVGATTAMIAYLGLNLLWRVSVGNYKMRKRNARQDAPLDR